jgi:hypothetical protein
MIGHMQTPGMVSRLGYQIWAFKRKKKHTRVNRLTDGSLTQHVYGRIF